MEGSSPDARLDGFLKSPRETLAIELKQWLDLRDPVVKAKVARHLMALANNGGDWLQFGFAEQADGTFTHEGMACPCPSEYSTDAINAVVARHAKPAFQCDVSWVPCRFGCPGDHALIRVAGGHKVPIVCRQGGPEPKLDPKKGVIYARLPGPQSAPVVEPEDWHGLLERCMRFRRDELVENFRGALQLIGAEGWDELRSDTKDGEDARGDDQESPAKADGAKTDPTTSPSHSRFRGEVARARDTDLEGWVDDSQRRLQKLLDPLPRSEDPYRNGSWSFAYRLEPSRRIPLPELKRVLMESVGSETGWPAWWWPSGDIDRSPHVEGDSIECWMHGGVFNDPSHADFWRANSDLELYLLRGYDEDGAAQLSPQHQNVKPGSALDPVLPVWRVGECLLHADRLARRIGADRIAVDIVWSGLAGRSLLPLDPLRYAWPAKVAQADAAQAWLTVEADLIASSLPNLVRELTEPLFVRFDFFEMPMDTIELELDRLRGIAGV